MKKTAVVQSVVVVDEVAQAMVSCARKTYELQKSSLGFSAQLLDFKLEVTLRRIENERHGKCDCGKMISALELKSLEIFCYSCKEKQVQQKMVLENEKNKLVRELNEVQGLTKTDLRDNSHTSQSNHEADSSPSNINSNLTIRIPGLQKRIKALEDAQLRIPFGTYGVCEECETDIPLKRLALVPFATRCVDCQSTKSSGKIKALVFTV